MTTEVTTANIDEMDQSPNLYVTQTEEEIKSVLEDDYFGNLKNEITGNSDIVEKSEIIVQDEAPAVVDTKNTYTTTATATASVKPSAANEVQVTYTILKNIGEGTVSKAYEKGNGAYGLVSVPESMNLSGPFESHVIRATLRKTHEMLVKIYNTEDKHNYIMLNSVPRDTNLSKPGTKFYAVSESAMNDFRKKHPNDIVVSRTLEDYTFLSGVTGMISIDVDDVVPDDVTDPVEIEKIKEVAYNDLMNNPNILSKINGKPHLMSFYDHIINDSSSGPFYDEVSGALIKPAKGFRIHIVVDDMAKTPDILQILFDRNALSGYARIRIYSNGFMSDRSMVDMAMARPTQPDFICESIVPEGMRHIKKPIFVEGKGKSGQAIPANAFKALTKDEKKQVKDQFEYMRRVTEPEAKSTEAKYLAGLSVEKRNQFLEFKDARDFPSNFIVERRNGQSISLEDWIKAGDFEGEWFYHPLHGRTGTPHCRIYKKNNGYVIWDTKNRVYHNITFPRSVGDKKPVVLRWETNNPLSNNTANVFDVLIKRGDFFRHGHMLAHLDDAEGFMLRYEQKDDDFHQFLESKVVTFDMGNGRTELSEKIVQRLVTVNYGGLPNLRYTSRVPFFNIKTLELENTEPGMNEEQSRFYIDDNTDVQIYKHLTIEEIVQKLMHPFEEYENFSTENEKWMLLSAIGLILLKEINGTQPHIMIHANGLDGTNSGKSSIQEALEKLWGGGKSAVPFGDNNNIEISKSISTALMKYPRNMISIDNIKDNSTVDNQLLIDIATQEQVQPRILGKSDDRIVFPNIPVMFSGNGITTNQDLSLRVHDISLESQQEKHFAFKPSDRVNRKEFLNLYFSLIHWAYTEGDAEEYRNMMTAEKFGKGYVDFIRLPTYVVTKHLTGEAFDIKSRMMSNFKERKSGNADIFIDMLDHFWNEKGVFGTLEQKSITFRYSEFAEICEKQIMMVVKRNGNLNDFSPTFGKRAKSENHPNAGKHGRYLLENLGNKNRDKINKYRISILDD